MSNTKRKVEKMSVVDESDLASLTSDQIDAELIDIFNHVEKRVDFLRQCAADAAKPAIIAVNGTFGLQGASLELEKFLVGLCKVLHHSSLPSTFAEETAVAKFGSIVRTMDCIVSLNAFGPISSPLYQRLAICVWADSVKHVVKERFDGNYFSFFSHLKGLKTWKDSDVFPRIIYQATQEMPTMRRLLLAMREARGKVEKEGKKASVEVV